LKTSASLRLRLESARARESLGSVLSPDNRELPEGLKLSTKAKGPELEYRVESPYSSTSLSTVLALLRDVGLFQEVWLLSHGEGGRDRRT